VSERVFGKTRWKRREVDNVVMILAILLCIAVVISAIAAERSARARHRFRAVCLNLFGIGCLGVGLVSIYAWCQGGAVVARQVAMAEMETSPGTLVRLFVDGDQPAEHMLPEKPADLAAQESRGRQADPVERVKQEVLTSSNLPQDAAITGVAAEAAEPGAPPEADNQAAELPAEATDQVPLDQTGLGDALPEEMRRQVQIDYAARPAWVECEEQDVGPVHQVSVNSGPYRRQRQAREKLDVELKQATDAYINELLGSSTAARWIAYDESRIHRSLVAPGNIYDEKVISPSVGVMHQSHALLEFGPEFHRDVEQAWRQIVARARLVKVALAAAAVLGTLTLLFSYFQADTATKGFYTGRLKFVTLVAILGLIVSGFLLARSIPWLWP
jgi:hypothetical protein